MKFPVLIPSIFDHPFTYSSDINLNVGDYVEVPFGKKKEIAPFNKTRSAFSDGTNNWSRNHHVEKGEELLA